MLETDHVTGLAPRGELERWFATLAGSPGGLAAVLADVVGLKEINRQSGFAAGDAGLPALRAAATAAGDREPLGQLIDRLYATVRHS